MNITEAIKELWKEGFFESHRAPKETKNQLREKYGMNPSNISVGLKRCSFLRKEKNGWIQKIRYGLEERSNKHSPDDLASIIDDKRLVNACKTNFDSENYSDCVFNAIRHLEVRIRKKAGLSAEDYGVDLIEKAFKPRTGVLTIPSCSTPSELDGFKQIVRGIIQFHRNPKGHREDRLGKNPTLRIIAYVDYLLTIVETAEKR